MPARNMALMVAAGVLLGSSFVNAERKSKAAQIDTGADREVTDVLRQESTSPLDRRTSLQVLLLRLPDSAAARWQSGFTKGEKTWRSFDAPIQADRAELLAEYRKHRSEASQTARGQLSLASWCSAHDLKDEERAHRTAALVLASPAEQPPILKSLGYQPVGGEWRSPREARDWKRSAQEAESSLRLWGPKIERIVRQLHANPREAIVARAALLDIRDPAAIPALEIHLGQHEPALLVDKLSHMPAYEASLALAGIAVFSNSAEVRSSATQSLRTRRWEDFVPPLIQTLNGPAQWDIVAAKNPATQTLFWQSRVFYETGSQIRIWRTSKLIAPRVAHYSEASGFLGIWGVDSWDDIPVLQGSPRSDYERLVADDIHQSQQRTHAMNAAIKRLNGRVSAVLAELSGRENSTDAQVWSSWWAEHSGLKEAASGQKQVVVVDEEEQYFPFWVGWRSSCFQAGTPVWTESGQMPIELIRVGDRVLSQDTETGELAYKPVLYTCVRAPRPLMRIDAGGDSLNCTDGHRFWVSGEAWTKARDLRAQQLLHTARGTIPVESVTEADVDRTFNLVVADFHSYFVGKQAMLVQDLPLPRSTNCVVPGLQPEW